LLVSQLPSARNSASSLQQSLLASTHAASSGQAALANQRPPGHGSPYKQTLSETIRMVHATYVACWARKERSVQNLTSDTARRELPGA